MARPKKEVATTEVLTPDPRIIEKVSNMTEVALGFRQNDKGEFELTKVEYSTENNEAQVVSVRNLGKDRLSAQSEFKLALFKEGLVR